MNKKRNAFCNRGGNGVDGRQRKMRRWKERAARRRSGRGTRGGRKGRCVGGRSGWQRKGLPAMSLEEFDSMKGNYEVNRHAMRLMSIINPTSKELRIRSVTMKTADRLTLEQIGVCLHYPHLLVSHKALLRLHSLHSTTLPLPPPSSLEHRPPASSSEPFPLLPLFPILYHTSSPLSLLFVSPRHLSHLPEKSPDDINGKVSSAVNKYTGECTHLYSYAF
ncbi:hypothetical protein PIB30_003952 [Stylosanthes scabra]|uniref:Uncharacterized protein n=1 Tax=Stylosanthes scabra TaxID=79078 RepID=A0ABU6V492_9FABA|nr:hypothetical protein [Stylosanthes scabra]